MIYVSTEIIDLSEKYYPLLTVPSKALFPSEITKLSDVQGDYSLEFYPYYQMVKVEDNHFYTTVRAAKTRTDNLEEAGMEGINLRGIDEKQILLDNYPLSSLKTIKSRERRRVPDFLSRKKDTDYKTSEYIYGKVVKTEKDQKTDVSLISVDHFRDLDIVLWDKLPLSSSSTGAYLVKIDGIAKVLIYLTVIGTRSYLPYDNVEQERIILPLLPLCFPEERYEDLYMRIMHEQLPTISAVKESLKIFKLNLELFFEYFENLLEQPKANDILVSNKFILEGVGSDKLYAILEPKTVITLWDFSFIESYRASLFYVISFIASSTVIGGSISKMDVSLGKTNLKSVSSWRDVYSFVDNPSLWGRAAVKIEGNGFKDVTALKDLRTWISIMFKATMVGISMLMDDYNSYRSSQSQKINDSIVSYRTLFRCIGSDLGIKLDPSGYISLKISNPSELQHSGIYTLQLRRGDSPSWVNCHQFQTIFKLSRSDVEPIEQMVEPTETRGLFSDAPEFIRTSILFENLFGSGSLIRGPVINGSVIFEELYPVVSKKQLLNGEQFIDPYYNLLTTGDPLALNINTLRNVTKHDNLEHRSDKLIQGTIESISATTHSIVGYHSLDRNEDQLFPPNEMKGAIRIVQLVGAENTLVIMRDINLIQMLLQIFVEVFAQRVDEIISRYKQEPQESLESKSRQFLDILFEIKNGNTAIIDPRVLIETLSIGDVPGANHLEYSRNLFEQLIRILNSLNHIDTIENTCRCYRLHQYWLVGKTIQDDYCPRCFLDSKKTTDIHLFWGDNQTSVMFFEDYFELIHGKITPFYQCRRGSKSFKSVYTHGQDENRNSDQKVYHCLLTPENEYICYRDESQTLSKADLEEVYPYGIKFLRTSGVQGGIIVTSDGLLTPEKFIFPFGNSFIKASLESPCSVQFDLPHKSILDKGLQEFRRLLVPKYERIFSGIYSEAAHYLSKKFEKKLKGLLAEIATLSDNQNNVFGDVFTHIKHNLESIDEFFGTLRDLAGSIQLSLNCLEISFNEELETTGRFFRRPRKESILKAIRGLYAREIQTIDFLRLEKECNFFGIISDQEVGQMVTSCFSSFENPIKTLLRSPEEFSGQLIDSVLDLMASGYKLKQVPERNLHNTIDLVHDTSIDIDVDVDLVHDTSNDIDVDIDDDEDEYGGTFKYYYKSLLGKRIVSLVANNKQEIQTIICEAVNHTSGLKCALSVLYDIKMKDVFSSVRKEKTRIQIEQVLERINSKLEIYIDIYRIMQSMCYYSRNLVAIGDLFSALVNYCKGPNVKESVSFEEVKKVILKTHEALNEYMNRFYQHLFSGCCGGSFFQNEYAKTLLDTNTLSSNRALVYDILNGRRGSNLNLLDKIYCHCNEVAETDHEVYYCNRDRSPEIGEEESKFLLKYIILISETLSEQNSVNLESINSGIELISAPGLGSGKQVDSPLRKLLNEISDGSYSVEEIIFSNISYVISDIINQKGKTFLVFSPGLCVALCSGKSNLYRQRIALLTRRFESLTGIESESVQLAVRRPGLLPYGIGGEEEGNYNFSLTDYVTLLGFFGMLDKFLHSRLTKEIITPISEPKPTLRSLFRKAVGWIYGLNPNSEAGISKILEKYLGIETENDLQNFRSGKYCHGVGFWQLVLDNFLFQIATPSEIIAEKLGFTEEKKDPTIPIVQDYISRYYAEGYFGIAGSLLKTNTKESRSAAHKYMSVDLMFSDYGKYSEEYTKDTRQSILPHLAKSGWFYAFDGVYELYCVELKYIEPDDPRPKGHLFFSVGSNWVLLDNNQITLLDPLILRRKIPKPFEGDTAIKSSNRVTIVKPIIIQRMLDQLYKDYPFCQSIGGTSNLKFAVAHFRVNGEFTDDVIQQKIASSYADHAIWLSNPLPTRLLDLMNTNSKESAEFLRLLRLLKPARMKRLTSALEEITQSLMKQRENSQKIGNIFKYQFPDVATTNLISTSLESVKEFLFSLHMNFFMNAHQIITNNILDVKLYKTNDAGQGNDYQATIWKILQINSSLGTCGDFPLKNSGATVFTQVTSWLFRFLLSSQSDPQIENLLINGDTLEIDVLSSGLKNLYEDSDDGFSIGLEFINNQGSLYSQLTNEPIWNRLNFSPFGSILGDQEFVLRILPQQDSVDQLSNFLSSFNRFIVTDKSTTSTLLHSLERQILYWFDFTTRGKIASRTITHLTKQTNTTTLHPFKPLLLTETDNVKSLDDLVKRLYQSIEIKTNQYDEEKQMLEHLQNNHANPRMMTFKLDNSLIKSSSSREVLWEMFSLLSRGYPDIYRNQTPTTDNISPSDIVFSSLPWLNFADIWNLQYEPQSAEELHDSKFYSLDFSRDLDQTSSLNDLIRIEINSMDPVSKKEVIQQSIPKQPVTKLLGQTVNGDESKYHQFYNRRDRHFPRNSYKELYDKAIISLSNCQEMFEDLRKPNTIESEDSNVLYHPAILEVCSRFSDDTISDNLYKLCNRYPKVIRRALTKWETLPYVSFFTTVPSFSEDLLSHIVLHSMFTGDPKNVAVESLFCYYRLLSFLYSEYYSEIEWLENNHSEITSRYSSRLTDYITSELFQKLLAAGFDLDFFQLHPCFYQAYQDTPTVSHCIYMTLDSKRDILIKWVTFLRAIQYKTIIVELLFRKVFYDKGGIKPFEELIIADHQDYYNSRGSMIRVLSYDETLEELSRDNICRVVKTILREIEKKPTWSGVKKIATEPSINCSRVSNQLLYLYCSNPRYVGSNIAEKFRNRIFKWESSDSEDNHPIVIPKELGRFENDVRKKYPNGIDLEHVLVLETIDGLPHSIDSIRRVFDNILIKDSENGSSSTSNQFSDGSEFLPGNNDSTRLDFLPPNIMTDKDTTVVEQNQEGVNGTQKNIGAIIPSVNILSDFKSRLSKNIDKAIERKKKTELLENAIINPLFGGNRSIEELVSTKKFLWQHSYDEVLRSNLKDTSTSVNLSNVDQLTLKEAYLEREKRLDIHNPVLKKLYSGNLRFFTYSELFFSQYRQHIQRSLIWSSVMHLYRYNLSLILSEYDLDILNGLDYDYKNVWESKFMKQTDQQIIDKSNGFKPACLKLLWLESWFSMKYNTIDEEAHEWLTQKGNISWKTTTELLDQLFSVDKSIMDSNKENITKILTGENWKNILQGVSIRKALEILLMAADIYADDEKNQISRELERLWNDYTGVTFILNLNLSDIDSLFNEGEYLEPLEDPQIMEILVSHSPLLILDEFEQRVDHLRQLCISSANERDLNNISGIIGQKIKNYLFTETLVGENWSNTLKRTLSLNLLNILVGNNEKFSPLNFINAISLPNMLNTLSSDKKSNYERVLKEIGASIEALNAKRDPISLGIDNSLLMILHIVSDPVKWDKVMSEASTSLDLASLAKDSFPNLRQLSLLEIFENLRIPEAITGNVENVQRLFNFFKEYEELPSVSEPGKLGLSDRLLEAFAGTIPTKQLEFDEQYWLDYKKLFKKIADAYKQYLSILWDDVLSNCLNNNNPTGGEYHKAIFSTLVDDVKKPKSTELLSEKLRVFLESWSNFIESKTYGEEQHELLDYKGDYLPKELVGKFRKDPHQLFWKFVVEFRKLLSLLVFRILYNAAKIISEEITFHLFYPVTIKSYLIINSPVARAKFALSGKKIPDRKKYSFSSPDNKELVSQVILNLRYSDSSDHPEKEFSESFKRLYKKSPNIYSAQAKQSGEDFETPQKQENFIYMFNFIRNYYKLVSDTP